MPKQTNTQEDRARVLMNIANQITLSPFAEMVGVYPRCCYMQMGSAPAQFLDTEQAEALDLPLKAGDIIQCRTKVRHPWAISEYTGERRGVPGTFTEEILLRAIGTGKLCWMSNESYRVLRFMPEHLLLTGKRRRLYEWAYKAFSERYGCPYMVRCGGVRFDGDEMEIWIRPHIFIMQRGRGETKTYAQPIRVRMPWSEKTRLKDIVAALTEAGMTKENPFPYSVEEPAEGMAAEGMAGVTPFTRENLHDVINIRP